MRNDADATVFADDNGTPLHWAGRAGANETLVVLIESGVLIEAISETGLGESALLFAIRNDAPLATIEVCMIILCPLFLNLAWSPKILVNRGGANVNVADRRGNTCLHRAAENGDPEIIRVRKSL